MLKRNRKIICLTIILFSFLIFMQPVSAFEIEILPTPSGTCPGGATCCPGEEAICGVDDDGKCASGPGAGLECNYSLENFLQVFVNISKIILSILGIVALMFFVYGGFVLLTSGGGSDKIKKGQDILKGTVFGIILVLGAWVIVYFIQGAIGLKTEYMERLTGGGGDPDEGCCIVCYITVEDEKNCMAHTSLVPEDECSRAVFGMIPDTVVENYPQWESADHPNQCQDLEESHWERVFGPGGD